MSKQASFLCDAVGSIVTVYIRGEIDHHTAVSIRNGIDGVLFEKRPEKLILDLSGVSFMDSSGLGLIMGRLSVMKSLGGEMVLQRPSRETHTMLQLSGMERLLSIVYTEGAEPEKQSLQSKKTYVPPQAKKMPCRQASSVKTKTGSGGRGGKRRTGTPKTIA